MFDPLQGFVDFLKSLPAGLLTPKTSLELRQVPRVVFHLLAYYILGLPESTGCPVFKYLWLGLARSCNLTQLDAQTQLIDHERLHFCCAPQTDFTKSLPFKLGFLQVINNRREIDHPAA